MEPANNSPAAKTPPDQTLDGDNHPRQPDTSPLPRTRVFVGPQGLRAGWSILFAGCLFFFLREVFGTIFVTVGLVDENSGQTAVSTIILELIPFLSMFGAVTAVAAIEHRSVLSYNLAGPRRLAGFLLGATSGLIALTALIVTLGLGGWLRFGTDTLSGLSALHYAALWGVAFLLVGCVEEGLFRCYLLSTLTRGLNFWWALASVASMCAWLWIHRAPGSSAIGVYLIAALGLLPSLILHQRAKARSAAAFWQAAWVTSTAFGLIHTFNHGENAIGIFAAAAIGFAWCASVRLTGSALWAIGCHAAWDWGETFFYGTADSGLVPHGHLFTTTPSGNPLFSGGADGPEGSLLILGAILLLLILISATHWLLRRGQPSPGR
ncbi:MAG TPA: CPBP family intramembrane glutamic endopeptidase [Terracidiphilus sp.]|nr:CPBP family intramembrane glutamic endopeptidase [Terracidiphilus sp.]